MASPADALAHAQSLLAGRAVSGALQAFRRACAAGADPDVCTAGCWECLMLLGRYEDAWRVSDEFDARQRIAGQGGPERDTERFWDGEPLAGKHVMLRCLHGYGDALQFIRYAPMIRKQARSLCVEAHPDIAMLLRAVHGVDRVITWGADAPLTPPRWDTQIEIMEMPRIFRTTTATIPVADHYLQSNAIAHTKGTATVVAGIQQRRADGRLQVGLSWQSSSWNPLRSVPLQSLAAALAPLQGCDLYNLQQNGCVELASVAAPALHDIDADLQNLAVRMAELDVILTIDGALAHLAGALGKPVLLLLPFAADWRWGLAEVTPWYPRFQLFRQGVPGEWSSPLSRAVAALRHLTRA